MKKKTGMSKEISGRKWRLTWILLILVFSIISVSATGEENSTKSHASDGVDVLVQKTDAINVVDDQEQKTDESAGVDGQEQITDESSRVDDQEQKTDENSGVDDQEQKTDENSGVDDQEQKTDESAGVDGQEQKTDENSGVDDQEQKTDESAGVDGQEQKTDENSGVDDQEQKTDESAGVDDQEQITDESAGIDGQEQITDESAGVDDQEQKTDENSGVDDQEQITDENSGVDDQEQKTDENSGVDDQEQITDENSGVDDQEQKTDVSAGVDDQEQKIDASTGVYCQESSKVNSEQKIDASTGVYCQKSSKVNPEQKTDASAGVYCQESSKVTSEQKTDASAGVYCQESSKVTSEQKTDSSNESAGEKTESKTEAYNGTKSLESGEVNPDIKVYNWKYSAGNESVIPEIKAKGSSWNNLKFIQSYPYSLRSFYTVNESVKIIYRGPETLGQQNIDIYIVKEKSPVLTENAISKGINDSTITLEDVFNNNIESYIQIPATLNKDGDLSPLTVGPLPAGSYWVLITLAGDETGKPESETEILLANYFEVLKYEMEAGTPYSLEEGESFEVNLNLKNAPAQKNYTYWVVLIREGAYTTYEGTNPGGTKTGIRPIVNGIDIIRSLETSLIESESETGKGELKSNIQTLIGKGNGMISIGEKNLRTFSLKSFELPPGDYLLLAGAYENDEGLAGIAQKNLRISAEKSYGSGLKSSSGDQTFGNISSRKYPVSSFLGINPLLETPKTFIAEDINPYIQAKAPVEVVRNPPKIPSFLIGFSGTLLIGLAVVRNKR